MSNKFYLGIALLILGTIFVSYGSIITVESRQKFEESMTMAAPFLISGVILLLLGMSQTQKNYHASSTELVVLSR